MITHTGIYRGIQPQELLVHPLLQKGSHTAVNDVTRYKDNVGLLSIHHIHPPAEFLASIGVAYVQVAHHHQLHGLFHLLAGGKL